MQINSPNQQQIEGAIRWLFAAGGPIGAVIVQKTNGDTLNQITALALYIVPPLIALIWSMFIKTQANQAAALNIPGVQVVVDQKVAPSAVVAAAHNDDIPNVVTQEAAKADILKTS